MKTDWQTKKLGEVLKLEYGKPLPKSLRKEDGGYPVYGANGIKDFSDKFYFDKPSIIVGRKGSAGEVNLTESKFWPLDVTYFVKFDDRAYDLKFLYNLLLNLELPKLARGVKPGINRNEVYSIEADIPPLAEQKRLVKILDEVFEGIKKVEENTEMNLRNAKDLFDSYLQGIFANPGKDWQRKKLREVCDFFNGKAHEKYIDAKGSYIVVNSKFISSEGNKFKKTKKQLFPLTVGDITMVMSDVPNGKALMKSFLVDIDNLYTLNQRICAIRSKNFNNKFLNHQLNRNKYFLSFDNGENQTNLRKDDILNCPLLVTSLTEQKAIVARLDALAVETKKLEENYRKKLADLAELRKAVLKKAFSGEL